MSALATMQTTFSRNRGRLAIVCVMLAAAWFAIAFGEQAWRARALQTEVDRQRSSLMALNREHDTLQAQVNRYATTAYFTYVQGRARRDLNLANPGETLLLVNWGPRDPAPAASAPTPTPNAKPNWKRWLELFGGD